MPRRLPLLALLIAASSCAPTTRPAPVRTPPLPPAPVAAAPAPPPSADWRDWPPTPGAWTYARDPQGSAALFGATGAQAVALLRCDAANRRVFLSRTGSTASPFTIRTSSATRQLATGATGGEPPYVAAMLPASDPLLDAIAFSRGRFTLEQAGAPPLVLPSWAEIGRVIEDCRG